MLVLAIIAMLGAIAAPRFTDLFERQKLRAATETIRLAWEDARLDAMRTGQAQVFRCELGTGNYSVNPLVLQSDLQTAGTGASMMSAGGMLRTEQFDGPGGSQVSTVAAQPQQEGKALDEGMSFLSCRAVGDLRALSTAQESTTSGTGELNTQNMATQVIFYPDGSTNTAEVRLRNDRGEARAVRIRGLTGHTSIVPLQNVEVSSGASGARGGLR